jgi:hypothetical protein
MSATANPSFELHRQTLESLKRVHVVCLLLEALQFLVSALAVVFQYVFRRSLEWNWVLKWYSGLATFFVALFAHVVLFYVIYSISKQVEKSQLKYPDRIHKWLVLATAKQRLKLAPYLIAHALTLITTLASLSFSTKNEVFFETGFLISMIFSMLAFIRAIFVVRANSRYLYAFVTNGGNSTAEFPVEEFKGTS